MISAPVPQRLLSSDITPVRAPGSGASRWKRLVSSSPNRARWRSRNSLSPVRATYTPAQQTQFVSCSYVM
ncbi:hypothetical protein BE08_10530 [Sorangium cellulosum]|uniref:Uncharacterized protein n=1 Tax=Sorangium cellulosum TaxID=56 RepID=A0A150PSG2_SORCE|nr:hypothetical protein BE08_10530 [Sorangium cellulosum]